MRKLNLTFGRGLFAGFLIGFILIVLLHGA